VIIRKKGFPDIYVFAVFAGSVNAGNPIDITKINYASS
jgi:hypothetical protein